VVAEFSNEQLDNILLVRNILESQAVLLSEKYLTADDISTLKVILANAWDALEKRDLKKLQQLNEDFHFTIYQSVPSTLLNELIKKTWRSYPKYREHLKYEESHASLTIHSEILKLIQENKFEEAAKKMSCHILSHRK
jgi:DNA-binding GntR family transcriptional regulator